MNNEKIWQFFQNEQEEVFGGSHQRYKYLVDFGHRLVKGKREVSVLNIGVGTGGIETLCLERGWKTSSLDPSSESIDKISSKGVTGKAGFIENIPFEDGQFDIVFCSEVIEHLTEEQIAAGKQEICRVLRKGGTLVGTVPFNEHLPANRVLCPNCSNVFHRWGHEQSFTRETLEKALALKDWELKTINTRAFADLKNVFPLKRFAKSAALWVLGRMEEPIASPSIFFVFKKI
jgi:SAM-dependent methyltransferase